MKDTFGLFPWIIAQIQLTINLPEINIMRDLIKVGLKVCLLFAAFSFFVFPSQPGFADENSSLSKATFHVAWYDVGKSALEGLQGVKSVDKGFRYHKEINTVYYETDKITIEEMEAALKEAGTYKGIIED